MRRHFTRVLGRIPFEAWAWTAGLIALAATDPTGEGLLSICGFRLLGVPQFIGLEHCPGCGLGHSVAYLLEGAVGPALRAHPLGPLALVVLIGRILVLTGRAWQHPESNPPPGRASGAPLRLLPWISSRMHRLPSFRPQHPNTPTPEHQ